MDGQCVQEVVAPRIKSGGDLPYLLIDGHQFAPDHFRQRPQQDVNLLLAQPGNHPLQLAAGQMLRHRQRHLHSHAIVFMARFITVSDRQHGAAKGGLVRKHLQITGKIISACEILLRDEQKLRFLGAALIYQLVQVMHR
jgi:hypothetical protein